MPSKIRFIGYAVPTTPANLVAIGNPNGPGAVAGTYQGNDDFTTDITARIAILKNAVDAAKAKISDSDPSDIINLFVAPEFYFHSNQGPYVFDGETIPDPAEAILAQLKSIFTPAEYPNWTFVFGSAITAKVANIQAVYDSNSTKVRNSIVKNLSENWLAAFGPLSDVVFDMLVNFVKNCHSYPNMEVRNRAMIVSNIPLGVPGNNLNTDTMTCEKYFVSNEDFLLYEVNGNPNVVTEQMTAYPMIDTSNGDLKKTAYDKHAIFRQYYPSGSPVNYMDFGLEICLDHSDVRLRKNIDREPWPKPGDAVHVHIIPSCGMQISAPSVAADANGFVFNCDGQYALDTNFAKACTDAAPQSGVDGVYVNYTQNTNSTNYQAHTQLARVQNPATGGDPNGPGATNATYLNPSTADIAILPITPLSYMDQYYAGGGGAVHIYGQQNPFELYPA